MKTRNRFTKALALGALFATLIVVAWSAERVSADQLINHSSGFGAIAEAALAKSQVSEPPYSNSWAYWECPDCAGLRLEHQESASSANGALLADATLSADQLSTEGGTLSSVGGSDNPSPKPSPSRRPRSRSTTRSTPRTRASGELMPPVHGCGSTLMFGTSDALVRRRSRWLWQRVAAVCIPRPSPAQCLSQ
jgi:hypothetical protein